MVDDHLLFREGLKRIINHWDDFEVVNEASNGLEALKIIELEEIDLILLDLNMPIMDGLRSIKKIRSKKPDTKVVMLTVSDEEENLLDAMISGADGYILKNASHLQLHESLLNVLKGDVCLSWGLTAKMIRGFRSNKEKDQNLVIDTKVNSLNKREREIVKCIAMGLSNREIGKELFLSENTVKKQLSVILQKMNAKNRVQAAIYAVLTDAVIFTNDEIEKILEA